MQQIDKKLLHSEASELISLLFPSEQDLQTFIETLPALDKQDALYEEKDSLRKSKGIYTKLLEAITEYEKISFQGNV